MLQRHPARHINWLPAAASAGATAVLPEQVELDERPVFAGSHGSWLARLHFVRMLLALTMAVLSHCLLSFRYAHSLGDVVGTFAWNTTRHLECWYGIMGLGGICHTLNPRLSDRDITYIAGVGSSCLQCAVVGSPAQQQ